MQISPFLVEQWMNTYETGARFNIAETCVNSLSLDELFALTGTDPDRFWSELGKKRLTYGYIEGNPAFLTGVCSLYETMQPENIIPTHGASGANHHIMYSLLERGDRVISVLPTYQQLYAIPASYGAQVEILPLRAENRYLPDPEELRRLAVPGTKLICLNNPNNPTGALMDPPLLEQMVSIARECGAYLLCDEVYRHLNQDRSWTPSIADLYEKGISIGSMSKVFSLAGLRLGWIACKDRQVLQSCWSHRDYNHISCGLFDEAAAGLALSGQEKLLDRSRTIVRTNLQILDAWIDQEPHMMYTKPRAGTTALVFWDYDLPSREFCRRLYEQTGVLTVPGDCFEQEYCLRIGYACDETVLRDGLHAVSGFLRMLEKEGIPCRN